MTKILKLYNLTSIGGFSPTCGIRIGNVNRGVEQVQVIFSVLSVKYLYKLFIRHLRQFKSSKLLTVFEYPKLFFGGFSADKIRQRIRLAETADVCPIASISR